MLIVAILFLLGLFAGSFFGVFIDRYQSKESIITGRSRCDSCRHILYPSDLVPLFSYALLNGKCRYCRHSLSIFYPVVEFLTAAMFVGTYFFAMQDFLYTKIWDIKLFVIVLYYLTIISILILIFFIDYRYGIIPFKLVVFGLILTLVLHYVLPTFFALKFANYFFSAVISFLFFLFIFLVTKGKGIGFGDVVFVFFMGYLLGFPKIFIGMEFAFVSGAIISLIIFKLQNKKIRGGTVPFGPFLVTGTIISLFWGDLILKKLLPYLLH